MSALFTWSTDDDAKTVREGVREWVDSEPMHRLVALSGWQWPAARSLNDLVAAVEQLSEGWDFRASRERRDIATGPLMMGDREVTDEQVIGAVRELGLVANEVPAGNFTHLVILGGSARACVNRTRFAAGLLRDGTVQADEVVALSAHRRFGKAEQTELGRVDLGFDTSAVTDESEVAILALRDAFGVGEPEQGTSDPVTSGDGPGFWGASAWHAWPSHHLSAVTARSEAPDQRRANTADQLAFWAGQVGLGPAHRVLLVTTHIYVPPQQIDAIRVLGLPFGCAVTTCGVSAATASLPTRDFGARDYLQEARSTLYAMVGLLKKIEQDSA